MSINVLLYEDNDSLRKGVEELLTLTDEFIVVGSFPDSLNVASEVRKLNPDVIIMDIEMPGMSGIEALKIIRAFNKKTAVIMLTVFEDNENILNAIKAGASGYLLKKYVSDKLVPAIHEALSGGAPLSPAVAKMIIQSMQSHSADEYGFTDREREVLGLLCKGLSYKMIAAETGLAFETIRSYIKRIYEKLQVHTATEAVSKAINEKLI